MSDENVTQPITQPAQTDDKAKIVAAVIGELVNEAVKEQRALHQHVDHMTVGELKKRLAKVDDWKTVMVTTSVNGGIASAVDVVNAGDNMSTFDICTSETPIPDWEKDDSKPSAQ